MKATLFHLGFPEYVMGLANALASMDVEVEVIHPTSLSGVCNALADNRVKLSSFEKPAFRRDPRNLGAIRRAFRLIHDSRPDVLHVQESFDYAYDLYSVIARFPRLGNNDSRCGATSWRWSCRTRASIFESHQLLAILADDCSHGEDADAARKPFSRK